MKRKLIRILAAVTALLSVALLAVGCGNVPLNELHDKDYEGELVYPSSTLNAAALYDSVPYSAEMFKGDYFLKAGLDSKDEYLANSNMWSTTIDSHFDDDELRNLTYIPMHLTIGENVYTGFGLHDFTEYVWGEASFLTDAGNIFTLIVAVEVKDDTLCLIPVSHVEQLGEEDKYRVVSYTLSDTVLEYGFEFHGMDLTLSADGKSVELAATDTTDYMRDYNKNGEFQISTDAYLAADSPRLDNIVSIDFLTNTKKSDFNRFYVRVEEEPGAYPEAYEATGILGEDGLFTFSYTDDEGAVHSYQLLYFYLDDSGLVLYDGDTVYYYTASYFTDLDGVVAEEDADALSNLSPEDYTALVEKKNSLFEALSEAFAEAGIAASVDPVSGEIAIDSAVLFDVNDATISEDGKAFLTSFWEVYTSVVGADEYTDFLASIVVEGHADPSGNYDDNMVLSEARANAVLEFCEGLGGSTAPLESIGYSSSRPVRDADGEVDYDASRRVAFKFRIKL